MGFLKNNFRKHLTVRKTVVSLCHHSRIKIKTMEFIFNNHEPVLLFNSKEDRDNCICKFPKSLRVRTFTLWVSYNQVVVKYGITIYVVRAKNHFKTNKVTGEKNETGEKRIAKFVSIAQSLIK